MFHDGTVALTYPMSYIVYGFSVAIHENVERGIPPERRTINNFR